MEKGKRILIVEDEAISAMALERLLKDIGCVVVKIVATGEDAIASAMTEQPDIIAMDIRLAGKMDGIDAATRIESELGIPIIFMTGYDDAMVKARAMRLKPLGYVVKPIDLQKMKGAMGIP
jgi:two-component system, response regulator PdtaR